MVSKKKIESPTEGRKEDEIDMKEFIKKRV